VRYADYALGARGYAAAGELLDDEEPDELEEPEPLVLDELLDEELSDLPEDELSEVPDDGDAGALELDEPPRLSVR
jgi:hypothetical protein